MLQGCGTLLRTARGQAKPAAAPDLIRPPPPGVGRSAPASAPPRPEGRSRAGASTSCAPGRNGSGIGLLSAVVWLVVLPELSPDLRTATGVTHVRSRRHAEGVDGSRRHRPPVPPPDLVHAGAGVDGSRSTTRSSCRTSCRTTRDAARSRARPIRTGCRWSSCRVTGRRSRRRRPPCWPAGTRAAPAPLDLPRAGAAAVPRRPASCASSSATTGRRCCCARPARPAGASRSRSTSSARGVDGLADGVHWYDPVGHALLQVGPPPAGEATDARRHRRAVAHRLALRGARLPPHLLGRRHDARAGARAGGVGGLAPRLWTRFPDAEVTRLVGADGVHEFPVALVALGDGDAGDRAARRRRRAGDGRRRPARVPAVTLRPARRRRRRARRSVAARRPRSASQPPGSATSTR